MTVWRLSTRSAENSCGIRELNALETGTKERLQSVSLLRQLRCERGP